MEPRVVIHVHPGVPWQRDFAPKVAAGLRAVGITSAFTTATRRVGAGLPILLGTSFWRAVEATGPYLLVDRCSFGDPGQWVSLVLDGHGRRGDQRVPPRPDPSRWERHAVPVAPWHSPERDGRAVLCGQCEPYSPHHATIEDWYDRVADACTHFRPHPATRQPIRRPCRAAGLPQTDTWQPGDRAITLNSSVAVETVLRGIPTVAMDEAAMAWDVTGHGPDEVVMADRLPWLHWLAWTQWSHDEIRTGVPWPRFF